jgi:hypothetical protein
VSRATRAFHRDSVVAGAAFGIATAVYADIPDNGTIYGCYAKAGSPSQGDLRVVEQGSPCKPTENQISWAAGSNVGNVYYGSGGNINSNGGSGVTIASVTVPAGSYEVSATGWAASLVAGVTTARCYIDQPNGNPDDTFLTTAGIDGIGDAGQVSFAVHLDVVTSGGLITVGCLDSAAPADLEYGAQLTATTANNLSGATFLKAKNPAKATSTP